VSISGDSIVVGAYGESSNGLTETDNSKYHAGAAYVFMLDGTTWTQQGYLKTDNPSSADDCGFSVSISGNLVAMGCGVLDDVFLFEWDGDNWEHQETIEKPAGLTLFGSIVSIADNTLAVFSITNTGVSGVHVFVRDGLGTWQYSLNKSDKVVFFFSHS
jgi:hypothetical protein